MAGLYDAVLAARGGTQPTTLYDQVTAARERQAADAQTLLDAQNSPTLLRGLRMGLRGAASGITGYGAGALEAMGSPAAADWYASAQEHARQAQLQGPAVQQWSQVNDPSTFADYALGQMGAAVPLLGPAMVAGGLANAARLSPAATMAATMAPMHPILAGGAAMRMHEDPVSAAAPAGDRFLSANVEGGLSGALLAAMPGYITARAVGRAGAAAPVALNPASVAGGIAADTALSAAAQGAAGVGAGEIGRTIQRSYNPAYEPPGGVDEARKEEFWSNAIGALPMVAPLAVAGRTVGAGGRAAADAAPDAAKALAGAAGEAAETVRRGAKNLKSRFEQAQDDARFAAAKDVTEEPPTGPGPYARLLRPVDTGPESVQAEMSKAGPGPYTPQQAAAAEASLYKSKLDEAATVLKDMVDNDPQWGPQMQQEYARVVAPIQEKLQRGEKLTADDRRELDMLFRHVDEVKAQRDKLGPLTDEADFIAQQKDEAATTVHNRFRDIFGDGNHSEEALWSLDPDKKAVIKEMFEVGLESLKDAVDPEEADLLRIQGEGMLRDLDKDRDQTLEWAKDWAVRVARITGQKVEGAQESRQRDVFSATAYDIVKKGMDENTAKAISPYVNADQVEKHGVAGMLRKVVGHLAERGIGTPEDHAKLVSMLKARLLKIKEDRMPNVPDEGTEHLREMFDIDVRKEVDAMLDKQMPNANEEQRAKVAITVSEYINRLAAGDESFGRRAGKFVDHIIKHFGEDGKALLDNVYDMVEARFGKASSQITRISKLIKDASDVNTVATPLASLIGPRVVHSGGTPWKIAEALYELRRVALQGLEDAPKNLRQLESQIAEAKKRPLTDPAELEALNKRLYELRKQIGELPKNATEAVRKAWEGIVPEENFAKVAELVDRYSRMDRWTKPERVVVHDNERTKRGERGDRNSEAATQGAAEGAEGFNKFSTGDEAADFAQQQQEENTGTRGQIDRQPEDYRGTSLLGDKVEAPLDFYPAMDYADRHSGEPASQSSAALKEASARYGYKLTDMSRRNVLKWADEIQQQTGKPADASLNEAMDALIAADVRREKELAKHIGKAGVADSLKFIRARRDMAAKMKEQYGDTAGFEFFSSNMNRNFGFYKLSQSDEANLKYSVEGLQWYGPRKGATALGYAVKQHAASPRDEKGNHIFNLDAFKNSLISVRTAEGTKDVDISRLMDEARRHQIGDTAGVGDKSKVGVADDMRIDPTVQYSREELLNMFHTVLGTLMTTEGVKGIENLFNDKGRIDPSLVVYRDAVNRRLWTYGQLSGKDASGLPPNVRIGRYVGADGKTHTMLVRTTVSAADAPKFTSESIAGDDVHAVALAERGVMHGALTAPDGTKLDLDLRGLLRHQLEAYGHSPDEVLRDSRTPRRLIAEMVQEGIDQLTNAGFRFTKPADKSAQESAAVYGIDYGTKASPEITRDMLVEAYLRLKKEEYERKNLGALTPKQLDKLAAGAARFDPDEANPALYNRLLTDVQSRLVATPNRSMVTWKNLQHELAAAKANRMGPLPKEDLVAARIADNKAEVERLVGELKTWEKDRAEGMVTEEALGGAVQEKGAEIDKLVSDLDWITKEFDPNDKVTYSNNYAAEDTDNSRIAQVLRELANGDGAPLFDRSTQNLFNRVADELMYHRVRLGRAKLRGENATDPGTIEHTERERIRAENAAAAREEAKAAAKKRTPEGGIVREPDAPLMKGDPNRTAEPVSRDALMDDFGDAYARGQRGVPADDFGSTGRVEAREYGAGNEQFPASPSGVREGERLLPDSTIAPYGPAHEARLREEAARIEAQKAREAATTAAGQQTRRTIEGMQRGAQAEALRSGAVQPVERRTVSEGGETRTSPDLYLDAQTDTRPEGATAYVDGKFIGVPNDRPMGNTLGMSFVNEPPAPKGGRTLIKSAAPGAQMDFLVGMAQNKQQAPEVVQAAIRSMSAEQLRDAALSIPAKLGERTAAQQQFINYLSGGFKKEAKDAGLIWMKDQNRFVAPAPEAPKPSVEPIFTKKKDDTPFSEGKVRDTPYTADELRAGVEQATADFKKSLGELFGLKFKNEMLGDKRKAVGLTDTDVKEVIISTLAADIPGVGHHETWHAVRSLLEKMGDEGKQVLDTMSRLADTPLMRKWLYEQFNGDEGALDQIMKSGLEREAYIYQAFRRGNSMPLHPEAKNILQKVVDFLKNVAQKFGIEFTTDAERANNFFKYVADGGFVRDHDNPLAVLRAMGEKNGDKFTNMVKRNVLDPIAKANDIALGFTGERIDATGVEAYRQIRLLFEGELGKGGFQLDHDRFSQKFLNEVDDVFKGAGDAKARTERALGKEYDALIGRLKRYANERGDMDAKEFRQLQRDLFVADQAKVEKNMKEFMIDLVQHGGLEEGPAKDVARMVAYEGYAPRLFPDNAEMRQKWANPDPAERIGRLVQALVKKVETERAFGKNDEKLNALMKEGAKTATAEQQIFMEKAIKAYRHQLGHDELSDGAKTAMHALIVLNNMRILPLAVFSQVLEPFQMAMRKNDMNSALGTLWSGVMALPRTFKTIDAKVTPGAWEKIARQVGGVRPLGGTMSQHHLGYRMGGTLGKINDAFFRYTGQEAWHHEMNVQAVRHGVEFLRTHAGLDPNIKADPIHSRRFLDELGLKKEDIKFNDKGELVLADDNASFTERERSDKVERAVVQFAREAIAHPDAGSNPLWMNDARFALISQFKPFQFAHTRYVLARAQREMSLGNNFVPTAALASMVAAIGISDAIRDTLNPLSNTNYKKNWTYTDHLLHMMSRSGLFGRSQFTSDVMTDIEHGGTGINAIGGPTIELWGRIAAGAKKDNLIEAFLGNMPGAKLVGS